MSELFEPYDFCGISLKNRFVRSPTSENLAAPDRGPSEELIELYEELARGEIGLIITSGSRADRTWEWGSQGKNMCIDKDELIPAFTELTDCVHSFGSKIALQLGSFFQYNGEPVAPSPMPYSWLPNVPTPRALTTEEIDSIVKIFGEAGERAKKAGFDAVELHAAHGYPLSRFLSPLFNQREDEYGGSPENRSRIIIEIAAEIRKRVGNEFPVFVKMGVVDFCEGGMTLEDGVAVAKAMSQNGIAAIETSSGTFGSEMNALGATDSSMWTEGYLMDYAAAVKAEVDVPVILVGGLRDINMMEEIISQGKADLVAMSRPFVIEPHLVKRWEEGDREPSHCISCNGCMDLYMDEEIVECIIE
jgi:2,4-dienoyl-CoA reductase-like NADH-dependent reductase (Old Yellow Enzyme family)